MKFGKGLCVRKWADEIEMEYFHIGRVFLLE